MKKNVKMKKYISTVNTTKLLKKSAIKPIIANEKIIPATIIIEPIYKIFEAFPFFLIK
jgi:hypothetical protein